MESRTRTERAAGTKHPAHRRYSAISVTLHWMIAAAIIALLVSGIWMTDAVKSPDTQATAFTVYQWHKSLGLTVLLLSFVRLLWRLAKPPPELPVTMGRLTRFAAHGTHAAFYVLMVGMPLLGWAMVSASVFGLPTIVFGLFEWPHIPLLADLQNKEPVEGALRAAHAAGAYMMIALLLLHVSAALKHQFIDRDDVLSRMLPSFSKAGAEGERTT